MCVKKLQRPDFRLSFTLCSSPFNLDIFHEFEHDIMRQLQKDETVCFVSSGKPTHQ